MATISGTIDGFAALPLRAGHYLLAVVETSRTTRLEPPPGPRFDGVSAGDQTCLRDATETRWPARPLYCRHI
jgi:hypothetical protein